MKLFPWQKNNIDQIIDFHHRNDSGFARHHLALYSVVLGLETKSAFEFGCGRSTLTILRALRQTGGRLISCDLRDLPDTGVDANDLYRFRDIWDYLQGDSLGIASEVGNEIFDFVLHDGSHEADIVQSDLSKIVPRMMRNSILLLHDTDHPTQDYGLQAAAERALAPYRHSLVTLPYGYGLTIVRIDEDFGHGTVRVEWRKTKSGKPKVKKRK
ncbi:MAG: class I SAM-dependent methyltransferase [Candidatus Omnitrophota bacterium]|nr:class I SAM-dependent methyltransferase [Candidatus Omnitrophota bacterium]